MGLSGPRNRRKLDYDPNNTRWTRDETTFGQKILRAHGWEPGKYLGSQESGHAQLHSAASLAPIKVNLKDDTLGLGAKIIQKQSDECTGLDVFKDLLGRLNGKSEETIESERKLRSEIKTNLVIERKYGPMRFVSGGLLVGDHMEMSLLVKTEESSTLVKEESESESPEPEPSKSEKKSKKSKKRKATESEDAETRENKPEKKRKKRSEEDTPENEDDTDARKSKKRKDKKDKKSRRSEKVVEEEEVEAPEPEVKRKKSKRSKDTTQADCSTEDSPETSEDMSEKARKKDKKEKKEKKEKDKKKEKKRKEADAIEGTVAALKISASTTTPASGSQDSGSSTPQTTGASTPQAISARHLARSRNIRSKKMAFGDMQALNQIFMIKPV
ncbi:hypothetical protein F5Y17DRAFT_234793 [Xylariaceae sp. FL0594]|nr:hypothetical protein F5Y17DRAFT_234793 [Xylariaceae sp. FL0594]